VLRKVRAALIITAIWVLFWTPYAVGLNQILADILFPNSIDGPYTPVSVWAIWGALCGLAFTIVLALAERGRAVGSLSTARVLGWAALGSVLVPVIYWTVSDPLWPGSASVYSETILLTLGISVLLGIVCAVMTLGFVRVGSNRSGAA